MVGASKGMGRQRMLTHAVEEVGYLSCFLPELYVQETR